MTGAKLRPVGPWRGRSVAGAYEGVQNRAPGFDTLRLVAASAVVLHHCLLAFGSLDEDWLYQWSNKGTHLGFLAVCVFFCLSGFLVTPGLVKGGDIAGYFSRRFMRIMPLLALVVLVTAFVVGPLITRLPLGDYLADRKTWLYLKNITTFLSLDLPGVAGFNGSSRINGALWTIQYEWLSYIILALCFAGGLLKRRLLFLLLCVGCAAAVVAAKLTVHDLAHIERGLNALRLFSYFGAGALVFLYRHEIVFHFGLVAAAALTFVFLAATSVGDLFAPFLLAYAVFGIGMIDWPWGKWLDKADLSYGIYLTHGVVLSLVTHYLPVHSSAVLFLIGYPLTCLAALATWTFVEAPALRHKTLPADLLRRIVSRPRVKPATVEDLA